MQTIKEWVKEQEDLLKDEDIKDALYKLDDELTFEDLRPFVIPSKLTNNVRNMFDSIITYEKDDNLVLKKCRKYQAEPGYAGKFMYEDFGKLSDEELMEEIKNWRVKHKVNWNVRIDSEGLSYNSTIEVSLDEIFGVCSPKLQLECLKEAEKRFCKEN